MSIVTLVRNSKLAQAVLTALVLLALTLVPAAQNIPAASADDGTYGMAGDFCVNSTQLYLGGEARTLTCQNGCMTTNVCNGHRLDGSCAQYKGTCRPAPNAWNNNTRRNNAVRPAKPRPLSQVWPSQRTQTKLCN